QQARPHRTQNGHDRSLGLLSGTCPVLRADDESIDTQARFSAGKTRQGLFNCRFIVLMRPKTALRAFCACSERSWLAHPNTFTTRSLKTVRKRLRRPGFSN